MGEHGPARHASEGRTALRLPRGRNASPWSRTLVIVSVVAVVLLSPLWLDPITLAEFAGGTAATPRAGASPLATPSVSPAPSAGAAP